MTILEFIQQFREPATDLALWREIDGMRRYGKTPCEDLPPTLAELQRGLRLLKTAGKLREEWPDGATRGLWSAAPAEVRDVPRRLF